VILGNKNNILFFLVEFVETKVCLHCLSGSATKQMNVMASAKMHLPRTKRISSEAMIITSFSVLVGMTKLTAEDQWLSKRRTKSTTQDSMLKTLTSWIQSTVITT